MYHVDASLCIPSINEEINGEPTADELVSGKSDKKLNENITSITIPNNVTVIELGAFSGCKNLNTITLSKNIKKLKKKLQSGYIWVEQINYPGTEEEWNAIEIDEEAKSDLKNVKINFNYRK